MEKIIILGHENPDVDSVVSGYILEKILNKKGYEAKFIIPDDDTIGKDTLNICGRYGLNPLDYKNKIDLDEKDKKYILVDHNERKLGGEIVAIIDHHPTNKEIKIDNYYNKKISSTACFICYNNEDLLDKSDLKLAIIATLVDTASFHSTKGRKEDEEWVVKICNKYDFNYDELYREGLYLSSLDNIEVASLNGLKQYTFNDKKVKSSYAQIKVSSLTESKIHKVIEKLKKRVEEEKLDAFVFIVYDMENFRTVYYLITESGIEKRCFDYYASRGDTIMPEIEKKLM